MIQVQIVEIETGHVVHRIDVQGVTSTEDRKVERVESGLLRQADTEVYFVRTVDTEEYPE